MKNQRLSAARLYLILDVAVLDRERLLQIIDPAITGGVDIVQLRDKAGDSRDVFCFAQKVRDVVGQRALFILNDRPDIARFCGADGVHLGQNDVPVSVVKKFFGSDFIVGCSCQTPEQVLVAQQDAADYIGFGSVYKTQTKPERRPMQGSVLECALKEARIPLFPIGGITRDNLPALVDRGASRAAVCRDILLATDPAGAARGFRQLLEGN